MNKNPKWLTRWGRWLATFIGFPIAGVVARLVAGDIDDVTAAALGGLAGGVALGTVQTLIGGIATDNRLRWIGSTAVGLAAGLTAGAALVDYQTDTASLAVLGAVSGAGVGLAQALGMPSAALKQRIIWTLATPALWAAGWLVTSQVIVDAERQHAVFGSSGAVVVCALAGVLVASSAVAS